MVILSPVKIVIVDDEPGILLLLHSILSEFEEALIVGTAENADETINLVSKLNPDLAFLDIELPDMDGIQLAKRLKEIKPDLAIVFVTAHRGYSLDAFELYAVDYILKPIDEERVRQTFLYTQQMLKTSVNNMDSQATTISVKSGQQQILIKLDEIFYIEKIGRNTFYRCVNGKFKTRETLQQLEEKLGNTFFRSHKSYIINIMKIDRVITYPNFYEIKFRGYENNAFLSRDRYNLLNEKLKNLVVYDGGK